MDIDEVLASTELHASGDQMLDPSTIPWVPQAEGISFRPLRICPALGTWTNLLRVTRQGTINLHRHVAPVEAWVISGEWRYLEHDWVGTSRVLCFRTGGRCPHACQYGPRRNGHTVLHARADRVHRARWPDRLY